MLTPSIQNKVDQLWNHLWSGGIANPLTAVEQISYLLFIRRLDAVDQQRADDADYLEQKHISIFKGTFTAPDTRQIDKRELRWSQFRHLPGDEMLALVRDMVFPFIKQLQDDNHPFSRYMHDAVFMFPKPSLLVEAVGIIDEIYAEIEKDQTQGQTFQDTQGDLYEYLLSEISSSGKNGQFRTPRHIIQMMCHLVDPNIGHEICDPAAGTGGFLLGAYQHIVTKYTSDAMLKTDRFGMKRGTIGDKLTDQRQWDVLKNKTFHGYDFDTTMVRIALMNLTLHGIDHPNFEYADTLSKKFEDANRFDIVLANPPFKGSIDKGDINENLTVKTTKTELLFVERIINLLRTGGRAAVIVPDGVLFGSSKAHQAVRKMLIENCELQGVISMPSGVFKPYAGVSTAVLVFVKGGKTEHIWFYDMQADGYSLDDKRDDIEANDIPDLIKRWQNRDPDKNNNRKAKAFTIPVQEIIDNKYDLSINRYKEIEYEEIEYDPPIEILGRLRELEKEILTDIDELEGML